MGQLELVGQVVDVAFEGLDFGDVVLLFLLEFFDHELGTTHVFLHVQTFLVELIMIISKLLYGFLVTLILESCISIVL